MRCTLFFSPFKGTRFSVSNNFTRSKVYGQRSFISRHLFNLRISRGSTFFGCFRVTCFNRTHGEFALDIIRGVQNRTHKDNCLATEIDDVAKCKNTQHGNGSRHTYLQVQELTHLIAVLTTKGERQTEVCIIYQINANHTEGNRTPYEPKHALDEALTQHDTVSANTFKG